MLQVSAGGACPVWCNVGATAVEGAGYFVSPATGAVNIPAVQQSANTFPMAPNGAVSCILPAVNACANSTTVSACIY
jgi:hypothetical protein